MYWPPINTIYYSVRIVLSSFVDYLQFNFWLANKCLLIFRLSAKLIKRSQSTHKRVQRLLHEVKRKIPSRNNSNFEFSNTKGKSYQWSCMEIWELGLVPSYTVFFFFLLTSLYFLNIINKKSAWSFDLIEFWIFVLTIKLLLFRNFYIIFSGSFFHNVFPGEEVGNWRRKKTDFISFLTFFL